MRTKGEWVRRLKRQIIVFMLPCVGVEYWRPTRAAAETSQRCYGVHLDSCVTSSDDRSSRATRLPRLARSSTRRCRGNSSAWDGATSSVGSCRSWLWRRGRRPAEVERHVDRRDLLHQRRAQERTQSSADAEIARHASRSTPRAGVQYSTLFRIYCTDLPYFGITGYYDPDRLPHAKTPTNLSMSCADFHYVITIHIPSFRYNADCISLQKIISKKIEK